MRKTWEGDPAGFIFLLRRKSLQESQVRSARWREPEQEKVSVGNVSDVAARPALTRPVLLAEHGSR